MTAVCCPVVNGKSLLCLTSGSFLSPKPRGRYEFPFGPKISNTEAKLCNPLSWITEETFVRKSFVLNWLHFVLLLVLYLLPRFHSVNFGYILIDWINEWMNKGINDWVRQEVKRSLWRSLTEILLKRQFSCSVVSDSLQPHESQLARPPCPSPTPGVHSDLRPSS